MVILSISGLSPRTTSHSIGSQSVSIRSSLDATKRWYRNLNSSSASSVDHSDPGSTVVEVPDHVTLAELPAVLQRRGYAVADLQFDATTWERKKTLSIIEIDDVEKFGRDRCSLRPGTPLLRAYANRQVALGLLKAVVCLPVEEGEKEGSGVVVNNLHIDFQRTLRVPDDEKEHLLPPGLGRFPLVPVSLCTNVPDSIKARGGFITPISQREALWINFDRKGDVPQAIKLSVGGVNALSGLPSGEEGDLEFQDYIVGNTQPWIDGIATAPGIVRQFVAMPLGENYTVEEQITGKAKVGGLQFDFYDRLPENVHFLMDGHNILNKYKTPEQLGINAACYVTMHEGSAPPNALWTTPLGSLFQSSSSKSLRLKNLPTMPYLVQSMSGGGGGGGAADFRAAPDSHIMGMSAGGKIVQNINKDSLPSSAYFPTASRRLYVHTVSPKMWETLTGTVAPHPNITPSTYEDYSLPWCDFYSEIPSTGTGGAFDEIKSVAQLDTVFTNSLQKFFNHHDPTDGLLDSNNPPLCSNDCFKKLAACVLRPCAHTLCDECLRTTIDTEKCPVCDQRPQKFVGFKAPVKTKEREKLEEIKREKKLSGVKANREKREGEDMWRVVLMQDYVAGPQGGQA